MCLNSTAFSAAAYKSQYIASDTARILAATIAFLSASGSALIIITYLMISELRRASVRQLLLYLSVAELCASVANGTGALRYFTTVQCEIQALITIVASLSFIFWTVSVAIYLYISIVMNRVFLAKKLVWAFHTVNWFLPLAVALPAYFEGALGSTMSRSTVGWCWISLHPKTLSKETCLRSRAFWMFLTLKGWELLSYIAVPFIYWSIKRYFDRQAREGDIESNQSIPDNLRRAVRSIDLKLKVIPCAFLLLRVWGTVRAFYDFTDRYNHLSKTGYKVFLYLQAIGDNSQGIVHFLLFICLTESVRKRITSSLDGVWVKCKYVMHPSSSSSWQSQQVDTRERLLPDNSADPSSKRWSNSSEMSRFRNSQQLDHDLMSTSGSGQGRTINIPSQNATGDTYSQTSFSEVPEVDSAATSYSFDIAYRQADTLLPSHGNRILPRQSPPPPPQAAAVGQHHGNQDGFLGLSGTSSAPASGEMADLSSSSQYARSYHSDLEQSVKRIEGLH